MLEILLDHAKIAFAQFQSGLGPQPKVDESEFPDDLAITGGRASVINGSGSSQSPNSTSRWSESPQATPMDVSGVTETTSPNASPVVSDAEAYNVYGDMDVSMGDVMRDPDLEHYNPKHSPSYPRRRPPYYSGPGRQSPTPSDH